MLETAPRAAYGFATGTSVAAAHVSGVAALLIERSPSIDVATLENILFSTAKDLGPPGRDEQFGFGLVDPYRALNAIEAKVALGRASDRPADRANDRTTSGSSSASAAPSAAAVEKSRPIAIATGSDMPPVGAPPPSATVASGPLAASAARPAVIAPMSQTLTVSQATPPNDAPGEGPDIHVAIETRRQACRQDAIGKGVRGSDMPDFVTICVAEARLACLKQAAAKKFSAAERVNFINKCLLGSWPGWRRATP